MYFTYIIYSDKTDKYYVGSTQNIQERLRRHNSNHSKSTKNKGPWRLVASYIFDSRAEAMLLEKTIKSRGIQRFLEDNQQPG